MITCVINPRMLVASLYEHAPHIKNVLELFNCTIITYFEPIHIHSKYFVYDITGNGLGATTLDAASKAGGHIQCFSRSVDTPLQRLTT
jgi:hypothetical protein